ncbi:class C beta-lactamase-related serine hydrolase [Neorhizobium sp. P12A]|uniref:serine hydrolase domain-containing protein n=1 Tax=Neorhizobium sp. P12A TaxID=2268027 RepID=UPI0011EEDAC3|nr:serine hydrolase [Neorhizobium sp. P12A]KAA0700439.1 class C beta-lactamase-related serine hydrolase [Neorhizobium sp. P12A]
MTADIAYPAENWTYAASPEAVGWSGAQLEAAYDFAATIGTSAIFVVQDGIVASEWGAVSYTGGIASMRKSLLSALIGIHVAEGTIDLRTTIAELGIDDCEPVLTQQEKQATIADLLTSRSGVYHAAVDQGPSTPPARGRYQRGEYWFYNNWDFNVLGVAVRQLTGIPLADDFDERIATPLQMQDFRRDHFYFKTGPQSLHPAYKIRMSPRDLARVGLLFQREGRWQDRQLIPAEWIRASATAYAHPGPAIGYGYSWWIGKYRLDSSEDNSGCADHSFYWASGLGNQYLMVFPLLGTVIVHTVADTNNGPTDEQLETLQNKLLGSKLMRRPIQGPVTRYGSEMLARHESRPPTGKSE